MHPLASQKVDWHYVVFSNLGGQEGEELVVAH